MSLVALDGTPLAPVGAANRNFAPVLVANSSILLDAANEACIMIGRIITSDGGSHTINTTGSSSIGWRTSAVTFANAGTTVIVGIATVDGANGPAPRAANAANVITFDVSKTMVGGGGGVTTLAWQEHVPDAGTKTISNGDLVALCVQMTTLGAGDSVNVAVPASVGAVARPSVTGFLGGTYTNNTQLPNAFITFADGATGWFVGGTVSSVGLTTITWNSASATKEYGNLLQFPFPTRAYGIIAGVTGSADFDLVLYSDPLGTPVAQKTVSVDANTISLATVATVIEQFASPYDIPANTPVGVIFKPGGSNISAGHLTLNAAAHQVTYSATGYAINRASGAFAAQNTQKDRFAIGLLLGAFDTGGYPASRVGLGM